MPEFILLEAAEEFVYGCVSKKVTGSHHVRHARHDRRRPCTSSRGQVEHRGSAGASLSKLYGNGEGIRALLARRQASGPDARAQGSLESLCGHRTRTLTPRTKSAGTYPPTRHAGRRSHARNWTTNFGHGRSHRPMRSPLRQAHPGPRSSRPRPLDRPSVAKVPLGPRTPSRQTDSKTTASRMNFEVKPHINEGGPLFRA